MDLIWMLTALALVVWLIALALQLADIGTARFDSRRLARGTRTRVRLHPATWVVPFAAIAIVGLGLGIGYAQRLLFEYGSLLHALIVCLLLVVALVAVWVVVTGAATSPASDSYRVIRDELVELRGSRVQQSWLDTLRARLEAIDEASKRIPIPPTVSWRSAAHWTLRRPQRVLPVLAAVVLLVFGSIATVADAGHGWVVAAAAFAVVGSAVLAVLGARASLTLLAAVRETQLVYRSEAELLLAEAEKSSRKPVAGLGDRVTRALQILREQQR